MKRLLVFMVFIASALAFAQEAPGPPPPSAVGRPGGPMGGPGMGRGPFGHGHGVPGAWWRDSELARELKLSDQQMKQLESTFSDYRMKLIDLRANVEREEAKLEPIVNADQVNESQFSSQLDALIAARTKLEKSNAMMAMELRKVLTVDQWKQLRQMHHTRPVRMEGGRPRAPKAPEGRQTPPPSPPSE